MRTNCVGKSFLEVDFSLTMLLNLFDFPLGKFYLIFLFPMENAMECAQQQVAEMQLLLSMFTPEELTIDQVRTKF